MPCYGIQALVRTGAYYIITLAFGGFFRVRPSHLVARVPEDPGELPRTPCVLSCEETDRGSLVPRAPAPSDAVDIGLFARPRRMVLKNAISPFAIRQNVLFQSYHPYIFSPFPFNMKEKLL